MSSLRFGGVRFWIYPDDHYPVHVHARYAGVTVVLELRADRSIETRQQPKAIKPRNAKRSDIAKIVRMAIAHFDEIVAAWEAMHP